MAIIQLRRGTAAEWTSANPVLADGEVGYETDSGQYKIGNGVQTWDLRPYYYNNSGGGGSLEIQWGEEPANPVEGMIWVELV